ncbi:FKBP-type peptidyl-prolyl cis-trans isomerase [Thaumasiovibrio sp. DFM-14]|uniref:FKBP-type peptidyl-prolyl cis-trans isomerase n=1 Tax=Thaumasiovibrio sp. DFM-14 TaxID=3384792 RepID=UPI0039A27307
MKPVLKMSALAATILLAVGCQGETNAETNTTKADTAVEQVAQTSAVDLTSEDAKAAYAIGASLGQYLSANLAQQEELGLELSSDDVLAGVQDAFNGESQMTPEEMQEALQTLDQRVSELVTARMEAEATAAVEAGNAFRTEFAAQDGSVETDSGLMYQVVEQGEGAMPADTDTVEVHYRGTLIDGTEFDSSYSRNQTASFPLNQVIPGWTEGLQLMPVGSKFKFVIPPELAYGAQNTPTIPANSTLIFEVELLSIPSQDVEEEVAQ